MTTAIGQARLHHLMLHSEAPDDLVVFYGDVMKMDFARKDGILTGYGNERCIMISEGPNRNLGFGAFTYSTAAELRALHHRLQQAGVPLHESPCPVLPDGFSIADPDGNQLVFGVAPRYRGAVPDSPTARLQHLVVATDDMQPMVDFYTDTLGFVISDRVVDEEDDLRACFVHSDDEHHSFAFFKSVLNVNVVQIPENYIHLSNIQFLFVINPGCIIPAQIDALQPENIFQPARRDMGFHYRTQ